jgi:glycosyltransferase involved in cell wall biosynthesis
MSELRILLFSSQIMNAVHYARAFSTLEHQFVIAILVPSGMRTEYQRIVYQSECVKSSNVRFSPIFLLAPDESLRNLCNPFVLIHDLAAITRTIGAFKPHAIIAKYVIHAYPLIVLKTVLKFALFVIVSGGDLYHHRSVIWRTIRRIIYSRSRAIFTVAERLKSEIRRESGYDAVVFPTGSDPDFFRPIPGRELRNKYGYTTEDFVILTVSQLLERKRLDDVIRACKILKDDGCGGVRAIIVGDGPELTKLKRLSAELGLAENVVFTGLVDRTTKLELFNVADVYAIPSYQEGLPFSLMEAMSCACICIGANVGDISVAIQDGINGFLISPCQPQMLAERIEHIMNLPREESLSIRRQARQTIVERFDFAKSTRAMIETVSKSLEIEH